MVGSAVATIVPSSAASRTASMRAAKTTLTSWRERAAGAGTVAAAADMPVRLDLASLPHGGALLREGDRALARVLRCEDRARQLFLAPPELLVAPVELLLEDRLRRVERQRAVGGDGRRQLERRVDRLAALGQTVDQPQLVGALGRDRVAGQRQLHRDAVGDAARQAQERARGRDERALELGDPELGLAGRDDEVAGERDLEPAGHREALDRSDQRLARAALDDAGEAAVADPRALAGDEGLEVHARAEARAGALDDADREVAVGVELVERRRHPFGQRQVDRVARFGTVERDEQDAVAALGEDGLVGHGRTI